MSFCRFSPSYAINSKTVVDNAFINDYLPYAPNKCGEVYLLGLMLCNNADSDNNTAEFIAKKLEITTDDVVSIFKYWEDKGLVTVLSTDPIEIRFLPVKNASTIKLYDTHKYADFNIRLQALFDKTMLMTNDYQEYYYLIEHKHMEQSALIEIVRFSIEYKGFKPNKAYAITLARDWENQGIHTLQQVKEKIEEFGLIDDNVTTILKATGTSRPAMLEDKELVSKWMNAFGFELNVIISVANMFKEKKQQKKLKPPLSCDCYGLNYSDRNFQTHTVAEIDQQWRDDINHLKQVLMEYEKIIEERKREEAEAAAKEEAEANEKSDKRSSKKSGKKSNKKA